MPDRLTRLEYAGDPGPPQRFLNAAQALESMIVSLRASGEKRSAPYREAVGEAIRFTSLVLAYGVRSSGNVSYPEIDLLREYHLDSYSVPDEMDIIQDTVRSEPRFLETVPAFLQDARRIGDTELSESMCDCIREMFTAIAAVDWVCEPVEQAMIDRYMTLIKPAQLPTGDAKRHSETV